MQYRSKGTLVIIAASLDAWRKKFLMKVHSAGVGQNELEDAANTSIT